MYQHIWESLKKLDPKVASERGVSITSPKHWHPRILKAVKKEKNIDLAHKLLLGNKVATLSHSKRGSILTFYLDYSLTVEDF